MRLLYAGAWLFGYWLVAGIDAHNISATLWLTQCAQGDPISKFASVYSLAHGQAFPYSFLMMVFMSAWHIAKESRGGLRASTFIGTSLMWLSMYPVCLISENFALRMSGITGVQIYAFLMLAVGSATMQLFNDKNTFPEREYR